MTLKESLRISTSRRKGETSWGCDLKLSILVPLYNTPEDFLRQMIRSVQGQTCGNWELCLADASDNPEVGRVVEGFARTDKRIRYRKLERNLGISENTNAALEMAMGEVIALLDHDDVLHPSAVHAVLRAVSQGADFAYTDEITFDSESGELTIRNYKPDFDPFYLLGANYICHFSAFRRELLDRAGGGFRAEYDGSQDHDLILRLTERARKVVHVKEALYFWRAHGGSVARTAAIKPYAIDAGHRAVAAALERRGLSGSVESTRQSPTMYRIRYDLPEKGMVSVIIPTRDHADDLRRCLESVFRLTTYPSYEIVIVDNGTEEPFAVRYLDELHGDARVRIVRSDAPFNFSRLVNLGAARAAGEYVLLLNNDTQVITPEWMEEMVSFARLPEVGAVGAKLYYPDGTIQHAGVVVGLGGIAGHAFLNCSREDPGTNGRMIVAHEYSAVTGACLMVRRKVFDQVGGFDPSLAVAFNDIDFCMRLRALGYQNVWTPFAELYHCESKSRGSDMAPDKIERFQSEIRFFRERWKTELEAGDPFYHPKFILCGAAFETDMERNWLDRLVVLRQPVVRSGWHRRLPFPLSKILGGWYCLRDNGWSYTWRRGLFKIGKVVKACATERPRATSEGVAEEDRRCV